MLPQFLIPETVARENGVSAPIEVGSSAGKPLLLTLGITRIVEQESLDISIWGSPNGTNWGERPLTKFPQKFYCGTYTLMLDLSRHPGVRYLRGEYKLNRWGRGDSVPLFGFYLFVQEAARPVLATAVA